MTTTEPRAYDQSVKRVYDDFMERVYPIMMGLETNEAVECDQIIKRFFQHIAFESFKEGWRALQGVVNQRNAPFRLDVDYALPDEFHKFCEVYRPKLLVQHDDRTT